MIPSFTVSTSHRKLKLVRSYAASIMVMLQESARVSDSDLESILFDLEMATKIVNDLYEVEATAAELAESEQNGKPRESE